MACSQKTLFYCVVLYGVLSRRIECKECDFPSDCLGSQYCCWRNSVADHVCRNNCIGEPCGQGYHHCAPGEICCGYDKDFAGICAKFCSGESCWWRRGCVDASETCCSVNDNTDFKCIPGGCNGDHASLSGELITVLVVCSIIAFIIIASFLHWCINSKRRVRRRLAYRDLEVLPSDTSATQVHASENVITAHTSNVGSLSNKTVLQEEE